MRTITKRKFYLISVVVFAIVIVVMLGAKFVNANDNGNSSKYKYYTSYKIKQNETLVSFVYSSAILVNVSFCLIL